LIFKATLPYHLQGLNSTKEEENKSHEEERLNMEIRKTKGKR